MRATNRLLHADVGAALGYNALFILMLPVLGYMLVRSLAMMAGRVPPAMSAPRWSGYVVLVVVLAFWVLRMLPVEPFSTLAP